MSPKSHATQSIRVATRASFSYWFYTGRLSKVDGPKSHATESIRVATRSSFSLGTTGSIPADSRRWIKSFKSKEKEKISHKLISSPW